MNTTAMSASQGTIPLADIRKDGEMDGYERDDTPIESPVEPQSPLGRGGSSDVQLVKKSEQAGLGMGMDPETILTMNLKGMGMDVDDIVLEKDMDMDMDMEKGGIDERERERELTQEEQDREGEESESSMTMAASSPAPPKNPKNEQTDILEAPPTKEEKEQRPPMKKKSSKAMVARPVSMGGAVPEGGREAWLTIFGGALVLFCTLGAVQAFGVYQDYYTLQSLSNKSTSSISWIGSLQIFFLFAMGLPVGKLFDEGYFRWIMAVGTFVYLVSIFMLSLVQPHQYYQNVLAQGIGLGLGMGLIFLPSLSIPSHYFRRRRSLASGFIVSGTAFGGIIWPILLNKTFNGSTPTSTPLGFAWGVRISGFIALAFLLIANLVMKTRLPPRKLRGVAGSKKPDIRGIMRDGPYWFCLVGAALVFWGLFFPFFYLQLFADLHGIRKSLTIYTIPILNAGALLGRTIPGFLADLYGPFNVGIPMTAIAGGLMFMMLAATNETTLIVFAILYGFFSGAFITLISSIVAVFAKDISEIGIRVGLGCFTISFALLTGNPISGSLLKQPEFLWSRPIAFSGCVILAGCCMLTISRHLVTKRKGTSRV